jgi:hypothetical protein
MGRCHVTLRFGFSSVDRSGARCGHRGGDLVAILDERGVQAPAFGVHPAQQDPSEFLERGLGADPNLGQRDGGLFDGVGPDLIGLSFSQPQGALRARTKAALPGHPRPLGMKLGQDGPQLFLGQLSALPLGDDRGGELSDVGFDVFEIATEFVKVGIDLGAVVAMAHPVESGWTGPRARHDPVTRIGNLPRTDPALLRFAGCIAHPASSSAL